ncbi:HD-GYP domain-containing protein [Candidatus Epulonipiscium viviparus]|uniref:HD-GYP domain-containing protein n=1 Tax=Candidatus Epulonipiscium viviparus TaxID=420336 RepID=UPI00016C08B7|nr:HD domain-containing phosphohydrolase [Candidatus Epulopiscium viviparus]
MRMIPLTHLQSNNILAIDILDENSKVLLTKGQLLTAGLVNRLKNTNLACVYIIDKYSQDQVPTYTAIPQNILQRISTLNELRNINQSGQGDFETLLKIMHTVNDIVYTLYAGKQNYRLNYEPNKLLTKSPTETNIYIAITTTLFALKLGWNPNDAVNLCLAVLLRDIGLAAHFGSSNIARQKHPINGANFLKSTYDLPEEILEIIREHHELYDGTGFPNKLHGDNICKGARILKIVDLYYNLQEKMWQNPARASVLTEDLQIRTSYLDPVYLGLFMNNVDIFHKDMLLQLTCGDIGIVVKTDKTSPLTPVLKIIKSSNPSHVNQLVKVASQPGFKIKSLVYYVD